MPATRIGESFPGLSPGAGFEAAMGQCTPDQHSPAVHLHLYLPATNIGESLTESPRLRDLNPISFSALPCTPNQHSPVLVLGADKIRYRDEAFW